MGGVCWGARHSTPTSTIEVAKLTAVTIEIGDRP